jgi:hypothetical protein
MSEQTQWCYRSARRITQPVAGSIWAFSRTSQCIWADSGYRTNAEHRHDIRHDERCDATLANGDPHRAVHEMPYLCGHAGLMNKGAGNILEHTDEIKFLLIVATDSDAGLLSGNSQNWHVIQPRIIEPGDQVRCART